MIPFHRVLITTGIVFCGGFALWCLWRAQMALGIGFGALGRDSPITCVTCDAASADEQEYLMLLLLLHGDDMDIIYFWSAIVMVALPLIVFGGLTYFVVKASRKQARKIPPRSNSARPSSAITGGCCCGPTGWSAFAATPISCCGRWPRISTPSSSCRRRSIAPTWAPISRFPTATSR